MIWQQRARRAASASTMRPTPAQPIPRAPLLGVCRDQQRPEARNRRAAAEREADVHLGELRNLLRCVRRGRGQRGERRGCGRGECGRALLLLLGAACNRVGPLSGRSAAGSRPGRTGAWPQGLHLAGSGRAARVRVLDGGRGVVINVIRDATGPGPIRAARSAAGAGAVRAPGVDPTLGMVCGLTSGVARPWGWCSWLRSLALCKALGTRAHSSAQWHPRVLELRCRVFCWWPNPS